MAKGKNSAKKTKPKFTGTNYLGVCARVCITWCTLWYTIQHRNIIPFTFAAVVTNQTFCIGRQSVLPLKITEVRPTRLSGG